MFSVIVEAFLFRKEAPLKLTTVPVSTFNTDFEIAGHYKGQEKEPF